MGRPNNSRCPKNDTCCCDKTNGRGVQPLQDGFEAVDVSEPGPKWNDRKNQNDPWTEKTNISDQGTRNSLIDGSEVGRKVADGGIINDEEEINKRAV